MSEQFHVQFNSEGQACEAERQLRGLQLGDRPAMFVERKGSAIFGGCSIFDVVSRDTVLSATASGKTSPFFEIFYRVEGMKSGMHHPDGMLWVRKPGQKHVVHNERVPLTSIAPTILEIFGVRKPDYMRSESLKAIAQPFSS